MCIIVDTDDGIEFLIYPYSIYLMSSSVSYRSNNSSVQVLVLYSHDENNTIEISRTRGQSLHSRCLDAGCPLLEPLPEICHI